jgi:hypothetical protein
MSVRNRVIYQSQAVYVSQDVNATGVATGTTDNVDLNRIQSCNYSFNISRQDVNQFGELAAIDRIITETPTVSLDGSYMMANLGNEAKLGFNIWAGPADIANGAGDQTLTPVSCISGIIDSETNDGVKNYYILTTAEGSDAIDNTTSGKYESIVGIGNASLTSYSTEGAVGGLPTANFTVEGQNMNVVHTPYTGMYEGYTGAAAQTPSTVGNAQFAPQDIDGYGYRTFSGVFTVTGSAAIAAGPSKTIPITEGNDRLANNFPAFTLNSPKTGISATVPTNNVFNSNEVGAKTITISTVAEKGTQQLVGTVEGGTVAVGDRFTGVFNDVVTYISGSNPSIEPAVGVQPQWVPTSGGVTLSSVAGAGGAIPTAPIVLPVPTSNLNTSDVNASGSISTLRPGDITLTLRQSPYSDATASSIPGASITNAHIQSYTISFDLSRTPIQKLGSKFAFARPVDFPITASFSFDAILADLTTGNIADIVDCDTNYDARVVLNNASNCSDPTNKDQIIVYDLKKLKMDNQSYSTSIGDNKTVTFDFTCQVGGPEQTDVGVFMSGYSTELPIQKPAS